MVDRNEKIKEIVKFIRNHPGSLASRTVIRRFVGADYEFSDAMYINLEEKMKVFDEDPLEIDHCYDLIK